MQNYSSPYWISQFSIIFPAKHDGKGQRSPFINKVYERWPRTVNDERISYRHRWMDNFNRWKVDDLKKNYKRQLIELSVNSWLCFCPTCMSLYQQQLPILAANVDDLEQVVVDYSRPYLLMNQMVRLTRYRIRIIWGGMVARVHRSYKLASLQLC